jgi:predicted nucleic acid-binding protein
MGKQNAVLDASFWINAHHGGLLDHLPDYFNLFAPTAVIQEIEYAPPGVGQLTPAGETFRRWRQSEQLKVQDPTKSVDWFHPGENAAIGLAQERGYALLIDDQAPYHLAKARGLPVIASADFVILLYADRLLSYDAAEAILVRSGIAKHLKRAAMTALGFLAQQRSDRDGNRLS